MYLVPPNFLSSNWDQIVLCYINKNKGEKEKHRKKKSWQILSSWLPACEGGVCQDACCSVPVQDSGDGSHAQPQPAEQPHGACPRI